MEDLTMAIRPQCSRVVLSYYQESDLTGSPAADYGTQVPDSHIDKMFEPKEPVILDMTQNRIDDAAYIKGHEWPQDTNLDVVIAQDISIPFSFPMSLSLAGILYALALGSYSVAANGAGKYIHTMVALSACTLDQLPSSSWILGLIGDVNSKFLVKGVVVNELKLVLDNAGPLTLSGTAFTDGTLTAKPTFVFPTALSADVYPVAATGDFKIDNASYKTTFRSFEFTISNNLDLADGRSNVINAGIYLTELRFGSRAYALAVKMDGHQGSTIWNLWTAETIMELDVEVVYSATQKITINFPKVKIAQCKQSFDGIRDVLDVTFKIFYDTVDATPITVKVYNATPEYLTLHGTLAAGVSPSTSTSVSTSPSASISPSASASPSSSVSPSVSVSSSPSS
jgi:hypothetical protein